MTPQAWTLMHEREEEASIWAFFSAWVVLGALVLLGYGLDDLPRLPHPGMLVSAFGLLLALRGMLRRRRLLLEDAERIRRTGDID